MQQHDRRQFAEIIRATFAMNPKWQMPNSQGIEMWWRCLERFTIEQVAIGFEAHLCGEQGRFQPMPADIITQINGGSRQEKKDAAAFAWQRVLDAIGSHGTYQTVAFDDPAIHWALRMIGGWVKVGQITEDEMPFRRKDFMDAYAAYRPGLPIEPRMIGIAETHNNAQGIHTESTIYIGDETRAAAIAASDQAPGMKRIGTQLEVAA